MMGDTCDCSMGSTRGSQLREGKLEVLYTNDKMFIM